MPVLLWRRHEQTNTDQGVTTWLLSKLNTEFIIETMQREERPELPEAALREAVVNALAHRDYRSNANVQIYIFEDRVEIVSPGGLPAGMTPELLGIKSIPRNPLLFGMLYRMDAVEQVGSGVRRIREICRDYGVAEPEYEVRENWVTVTFARPKLKNGVRVKDEDSEKGLAEGLAEGLVEGLVQTQKIILEQVRAKPNISKREMAEKAGISTTAIDKNISALKEKGLLKRVGPDKGGHWEVLQ